VGSRKSELALIQTRHVIAELSKIRPDISVRLSPLIFYFLNLDWLSVGSVVDQNNQMSKLSRYCRSLLQCPPAVEKVGGSIPGREMSVSGALVEDGGDLGQVSP
jgi:hypothetical protein